MRSTSLTKNEIELLIEQKVLELLGDPDSGLQITKAFQEKLTERLKNLSETISHSEILKKYAKG